MKESKSPSFQPSQVPQKLQEKPNKLDKPPKGKLFWWKLVFYFFVFLITVAAGILGYFCYKYMLQNDDLEKINSDLTEANEAALAELDSTNTELQDDYDALNDDFDALQEDYNELESDYADSQDTIDDYEYAQAKILAYNDFHDYFYDVIVAHGGFTGYTDAEYAHAHDLAEATGDSTFISAVENAWENLDGNPAIRIAEVMGGLINGIYANL